MNLPKNVTQDPNTGLYIITNSAGQKFRVNADTQSQLNQYVNSVNSGTPTTVTVTDPNTGNQKTSTFNPTQISSTQTAQANQVQLLTAGKRQAGVIGNADGTYSDLKTGQTITQQQAAEKITAAGLPPETLAAITPKSSPAYQAAQQNINTVINTPSNLTASESQTPNPAISADNAVVTSETDPVIASETPVAETPVIENATPAFDTGQNAAADAAFQEANASEQQVIDPNSDPNLNTNEGAVEGTAEAIQRQKDLEDGSLEFEGIDTQIANNENALKEPPLLTDEEVDQQIQLAAQDEVITSPDSITENVFDPRQEVTENVFDPRQEITENVFDPTSGGAGGYKGLQGATDAARAQQITQDAENAKTQGDWRVRLSLAPSAGYLYKAQNPGILAPLQKTDGVIFPYLPQIQVTYAAHYDPSELTHSNYKIFQYKNSSVDQVNIMCDFTAQDTEEANYMLAVIHFFRSVTKMFYGQDQIPKPGTPPPLCYLSGMGDFQFDRHPLVISSFNYSLPNDVDYIRASSPTLLSGVNATGYNDNRNSDLTPQQVRMQSGTTHLNAGAKESAPNFGKATNTQPTYVPTKISISVMAYPIVTRNDVSNNFSLEKYATGALLQGRKNPGGGGIW